MLILFLRAIILYLVVFTVIRLMGKRQISDLQPFDLVFTLLIADLASDPIANTSIPLVYGIIPILALYLMQQLAAYLSLKSEKARCMLTGKPQIIISKGVLQEDVMRSSNYTISDLMEQLRKKDVFDLSDVACAIVETDGNLSVMLRGDRQQPKLKDLKLPAANDILSEMLIVDGKVHENALEYCGRSNEWLELELTEMGVASPKELFFASLSADGTLLAQKYNKFGGNTYSRLTRRPAGKKSG